MPEPEVHFIRMLGMLQVPTANPKFLEQALGLLPKLSLLCDDVLNASRRDQERYGDFIIIKNIDPVIILVDCLFGALSIITF